MKPVVIAIVAQALWRLGAHRGQDPTLLGVLGVARGRRGGARRERARRPRWRGSSRPSLARRRAVEQARSLRSGVDGCPAASAPAVVAGGAAAVRTAGRFPRFLKIGSVLFGSGYVLLAFLRADLVERSTGSPSRSCSTRSPSARSRPGPVFTTATFIGYVLARRAAAPRVATVGIFLPAFVFVALSGPLVPRLRRSPIAGAFLDGVNVASLALMALSPGSSARSAIVDVTTALVAIVSARACCFAIASTQRGSPRAGRSWGLRRLRSDDDANDVEPSAGVYEIGILLVTRDVRAGELARGNDAQLSLARVVERRANEQSAVPFAFVLGPDLGVEDREMIAKLAIREDGRFLGAFDHEGLFDHVVYHAYVVSHHRPRDIGFVMRERFASAGGAAAPRRASAGMRRTTPRRRS